jgi:hypothetical protein
MGDKLGKRICIDNNARGDMQDKILRVRVLIPIARPLQRRVTLLDSHSNEEVTVNVFYERLPNFCLSCGVISHQEEGCDLPASLRKKRYNTSLGVSHTHADDPRKWYLAESAGENGRALRRMDIPWRNVLKIGPSTTTAPRKQASSIDHVAEEVRKLTVQDKNKEEKVASCTATLDTDTVTTNTNAKTATTPTTTLIDNISSSATKADDAAEAANPSDKICTDTPKTKAAGSNGIAGEGEATEKATTDMNTGVGGYQGHWKRKPRPEAKTDEGTTTTIPASKVKALRKRAAHNSQETKKKIKGTDGKEDVLGNEDGKEATSPGAAGQLTGASVSACQEP